ncbi:MAG: ribose transport system ATP-binding protein [Candidatus Atribacteria bacterium]|nr:ribose transport system ATP-binding protein [Candidatus Atribacteria bacterium]
MVVLEAIGIKKHFGGVIALSNANLRCYQGRITGLLGANGSGKSTMSKIICGIYQADGGEIKYKGKVVKYRSPSEARKDGIAMVFQNLSLVADLTVWQNIVLGAEESNGMFLDDDSAKELSQKILAQLLPDLDINKKVSQLNPGEMQIVEIAKAVSRNPQLLILDEPTAALEQAQVRNLFSYMRTLAKEGVAMIFTSHRLWEVMEICDDVTIFRNGENVASIDFEKEGKDPDKIIGYITGDVQKKRVEGKRERIVGETVLSVKSLNYGRSLKNVSFDLKQGEILGIGGLAGQGQIELMHALAGAFHNVRCDVELRGKKIKLNRPLNAIKEGVVFVPGDKQLEGLFLKHSVLFNIIFPKTSLPHPLFIPYEEYRKECEEIVDVLSIKAPTVDVPVETLSGGNQQKVVVGKWLPFDINVLLLADPAKGIDIGAKRDLYQYIVERVQKNNMSVILYASDSEELIEYCDRVLIMYEGQIVANLEGEDINEDTIIACSMRVR